MKTTAKFIVTLWLLSLASFVPAFAAGDSNKPTQSPSSEKPKKEDSSKPTTAATEVQPSAAAKPVESKASEAKPAEAKPSSEAKPAEAKPSKEAKPNESKAAESKATKEAKSADKSDSNGKKPDNGANEKKSPKADSKSNGKSEGKSDSKNKSPNPNSNSDKKESSKENNGVGADKKIVATESSTPLPSPTTSPKGSAIATQSPTSQASPESFVRIEKADGNKAVLVVSGPKIGSTIKITITSKGANK